MKRFGLALGLLISITLAASTNFMFLGSSAFSPTQLSGLGIWFDISQETGLSNSDPMSTLHDWSGNSYNCTGTTTTRPLYKTAIQNGKPAALFDGTDDFFDCANAIPTGLAETQPFTMIWVAQYNTKGGGNQFGVLFSFRSNTASAVATKKANFTMSYIENQVATYGNFWTLWADPATSTGVGDGGTWVGATHVAMATWDGSGNGNIASAAHFQHLLDNSGQSLTAHGTGGHAADPSYIGRWESGTLPYKGYLMEFIYVNGSVLNSTQLGQVETYLKAKWNTP